MIAPSLQDRLAALNRHFSSRRIRIGTDGASPAGGGSGRSTLFLVGRELCLFSAIDLSRVPTRQRAGVVAMAVQRAAPFPDPEHDVAWLGSRAAVFYWSRERVRALVGPLPPGARFQAEAYYVGAPLADGIEVLGVGGGIEARIWRDGMLGASRWWSAAPSLPAWQQFLRGAGQDPNQPLPVAVGAAVLAERPWKASQTLEGRLATLAPLAPGAAVAAAGLVAAAFAWQLGNGVSALRELGRAQTQVAALESELDRVLEARAQAESDRVVIEQWLRLRPPAPQLRMMAEVVQRLEGVEWAPNMWNQPNPETLEIRFATSQVDSAGMVSALESSPLFFDVSPTLSPRGDVLTLTMRVRRPAGGTRP